MVVSVKDDGDGTARWKAAGWASQERMAAMLQLGERQPVDRLERMVRDVAARCHITLRMGRWKKSSWSSGKDGGGVAARWKTAGWSSGKDVAVLQLGGRQLAGVA
jgi:hypothetical protein